MLNEPEKPKNYNRDYAIICLLALLIGSVLIYFRVKYVTVIPLCQDSCRLSFS